MYIQCPLLPRVHLAAWVNTDLLNWCPVWEWRMKYKQHWGLCVYVWLGSFLHVARGMFGAVWGAARGDEDILLSDGCVARTIEIPRPPPPPPARCITKGNSHLCFFSFPRQWENKAGLFWWLPISTVFAFYGRFCAVRLPFGKSGNAFVEY